MLFRIQVEGGKKGRANYLMRLLYWNNDLNIKEVPWDQPYKEGRSWIMYQRSVAHIRAQARTHSPFMPFLCSSLHLPSVFSCLSSPFLHLSVFCLFPGCLWKRKIFCSVGYLQIQQVLLHSTGGLKDRHMAARSPGLCVSGCLINGDSCGFSMFPAGCHLYHDLFALCLLC